VGVDTVENTLVVREFRRSERKGGGESSGVHVTSDHETIFAVRKSSFKSVLHGKRSGFGDNEK